MLPDVEFTTEDFHSKCGSARVLTSTSAIRLFCHRWDCPVCSNEKRTKIERQLEAAREEYGHIFSITVEKANERKALDAIRRHDGIYMRIPTRDNKVIIITNVEELPNFVPIEFPLEGLHTWLHENTEFISEISWHFRVTASRNFPGIVHKPRRKTNAIRTPAFIAENTSAEEVIRAIQILGSQVTSVSNASIGYQEVSLNKLHGFFKRAGKKVRWLVAEETANRGIGRIIGAAIDGLALAA